MNKQQIRRMMIGHRKELTAAQVEQSSRLVAERTLQLLRTRTPASVHVYKSHPTWNEIDTSLLVGRLKLELPIITLTVGAPHKDSPLPEIHYDTIIVPLLAFDDDMNRVGFGGGWYDRFLAKQPDAMKIGLAYDFQHVDDACADAHDVPITHIVTPHGIFTTT